MAYVGKDFSPIAPSEADDLTFDFTNDVRDCDSISTAAWTIEVETGTDAQAAQRLSGSPVHCGLQTTHRIAFPINGVKYKVSATATMRSGQILTLHSFVWGRA